MSTASAWRITCNDDSIRLLVIRQVGTVLSSRDHPLMAAVDTFAGPEQQKPLQQIANEQCDHAVVCLSLGAAHVAPQLL